MDIWRRPAARRSPGNHFSIEKSRLEFPAQSTGTVHGQDGFRVGKWPAIAITGPCQPMSASGTLYSRPYGFFGATATLPVGPLALISRITSPSFAHAYS